MIYENGFNNLLTKQPLFQTNVEMDNVFSNGISSQVIGSGDMAYNANLVDGHLQSANFVTGEAGWQINADGEAEFESGKFRGDISASSGTFGNMTLNDDATPNALVVNDGTNDRGLFGYLAGKF